MTIAASYMIGAALLFIKISSTQVPISKLNIYIVVSATLLPATLTFNHGITPLFYLIVTPFLLIFAYDFSKNSHSHILAVLKNVYWAYVAFIAAALFLHWGEPEPLGAIVPGVSTNGIPSYLIVIQIAYSIAFYLKNDRLPLSSSTATLVVAFFGLGRGSMIVGALILMISIGLNLSIVKSRRGRSVALKAAIFFSIPLAVLLIAKAGEISEFFEVWIESSKFANGVLDEHRGKMLNDYIDKIDGLNLIFGTSYENTSIIDIYGGNPHNSFIRVHSFYGIAGLILVFMPLAFVAISKRDKTQKFIVFLFVSLALLRATSEPIFFPSTLDFFYFLYFAIFFRYSRSRFDEGERNVNNLAVNCGKDPKKSKVGLSEAVKNPFNI